MSEDVGWIDAGLKTARPRAVAALLRYFGNVELAEEAFQDACLKALRIWGEQGPPRDPAAWLIKVGRNAGIDGIRLSARTSALAAFIPTQATETEETIVKAIDEAEYGDDVLRLLFICCHRDLPETQQIALALKVVSGLTTTEIARAFLVSEAAMEQRLTRARQIVGRSELRFETPSPAVRTDRLMTVAAMTYLIFNQGHAAPQSETGARGPLCVEAIRLGRLLLKLFPEEPELLGLLALMLLHDSRASARFDAAGMPILLEDQDRGRWDRAEIAEGIALTNRAFRLRRIGSYQLQAAIAALHAQAPTFEETDWVQIERLYNHLAEIHPTPVIMLNRAVAVSRVEGPEKAIAMIAPLSASLSNYFHFHTVHGHLLERSGDLENARQAYLRSLDLARSAAEAAQIRAQIDRITHQRPAA